jgi:hypothetical protein
MKEIIIVISILIVAVLLLSIRVILKKMVLSVVNISPKIAECERMASIVLLRKIASKEEERKIN